jgi:Domain of unknown function (DUF3846)
MSKYAITCTSNQELDLVEFDESKSYETIKQAIGGGTFQCIYLPKLGVDLWIDDEGKLVEDPKINGFGSALWIHEYGLTDIIVGDIIVTGGVDEDGKTLGLDREQATNVLMTVSEVMRIGALNYESFMTEEEKEEEANA